MENNKNLIKKNSKGVKDEFAFKIKKTYSKLTLIRPLRENLLLQMLLFPAKTEELGLAGP